MQDWLNTVFSGTVALTALCSLCCNGFLLGGVFLAFMQLRATRKDTKAQMILRLIDEWRSQEMLVAVSYVHSLRQDWKSRIPENGKWKDMVDKFAKQWVLEHVGQSISSADQKERVLANEWYMRRTVSQFLSKMGLLIQEGYLSPREFFYVVPETGRLLAVLQPIEDAIQEHFSHEPPLASWDHPFGKLEFKNLVATYRTWFDQEGKRL
jgi:hypothetical protein